VIVLGAAADVPPESRLHNISEKVHKTGKRQQLRKEPDGQH